jgi:pimeloyl-ACP methyl ester carboxylesterase
MVCGMDLIGLREADANLGQSYLLNEEVIGDSPHWDDAARDLIHMINVFQHQMPPPLIAMGQSWGGYPIVHASLSHPRLFTAIVPLEPYLAGGAGKGSNFTQGVTILMAKRRDRWRSMTEVRRIFENNPYFAAFDRDVFERVMENDFRALEDGSVTLITPKAQEVATMVRKKPSPGENGSALESSKEYHGYLEQQAISGFYRAEPSTAAARIKDLVPAVLYVYGSASQYMFLGLRTLLIEQTGIAPGANGGVKGGKVAFVVVPGSGHPMPLEKPQETAEVMVPWIRDQIKRWDQELKEVSSGPFWSKQVDPTWLTALSKI